MTPRRRSLAWMLGSLAVLVVLATTARAEIVWHGYTLNRVYQPQGGPTRFRTDRISLSALAQIDPKISAYVEVYYHPFVPAVSGAEPYRIYLESAYTDVKMGDGILRVGKGRRMAFALTPHYGNRKTTNYGIFSEAFTQDRAQGVQYFVDKPGYEYGVAVMTGMRVGNRAAGYEPSDSITTMANLADRDVPHDISEGLMIDGKAAWISPAGLKIGVTGSVGELDDSDLAFLNGPAAFGLDPGGSPVVHTSNTRTRYGVYAQYPRGNYILQGQYMWAQTSDIDHSGFEVLAGYAPKGMAPKAFVRYAEINMDTPAVAGSMYSWDKQQIAVSVMKPLRPTVWLQLEYEWNMEDPPPGVAEVRNNVGLLELFTGF